VKGAAAPDGGGIHMSRRRALAAPVALVVLVVAWWATRFVDSGHRGDLDALLYFLPTYAATWERFLDGTVPLWNPYHLCGIPWIATLQGGTFYPPHVVYGLLPLHVAAAVAGVAHLAIGALGMAAFVRRLGVGLAAALLAAVAFALRGNFSTALVAPNLIEAVAWLPVGAVAIVDLARTPSRRAMALLAVATAASFLAGYPQPTVYVVYAWASLLLALLIAERPTARGAGIRVAAFGGALALGSAVAAIQILPALELIGVGVRAAGGLDDKTMFPVSSMLTPAHAMIGRLSIAGSPFAFGVIVLALAPAAVLARGRRVVGWWAILLTLLAAAFSLGRYTPLFDLYLALPALRLFRNPARLMIVVDFALATAAALGLSALLGDGDPGPPRRRVLPAAVAALALAGVVELARRGWAPNAGTLVATFTVVAIAALAASLLVADARRRTVLGAVIAAAAVVEIGFNPWNEIRLPYRQETLAPYDVYADDLRRLRTVVGSDRVWRALTGIQIDQTLKLSTWYRVRTLNDYEPVNLQRQHDFFTYFSDGSTVAKRRPWLFTGDIPTLKAPPGGTPPITRRRLLDLAAVRWITFGRGALMDPTTRGFVEQGRLARHVGPWKVLLFENPAAVPRAFVTYRTQTAPENRDLLLTAMSAPTFDPLAQSFVEGPPPFAQAADAPPRGQAAVFVTDDEAEIELEVSLERPGLVVLADSYYPGWRATVDGADAPIVATNHLFRGVPAPAGTHRVRFTYEPASVRIGALLSAAGLLVVAWLGLARRGRRPAAEREPASPDAISGAA
jgi:hypothetical protein